jgi:predicted Zn-dependent protease
MSTTLANPATELAAERLLRGARSLVQGGEPASALPMLDRLARLPGHAATAAGLQAEALFKLADYSGAETAASAALLAEPEAGPLRILRARIRQALGHDHGAIEDAAAAVMAAPDDSDAKVLLAECLLEDRRFDEAIWFLGEAMRARPADVPLKARLGRAFLLAGHHEAARELLDHCAELAPRLGGLAGLRAQLLLLCGEPAAAEAMARAALADGVVESGLFSVLGHALVAQYRIQESSPVFAAAARLSKHDRYLAELAVATAEGEA